jgi:cytochrome c oxidase subunit 2
MRLATGKAFLAALAAIAGGSVALADSPQPWEMGFQPSATPTMAQIDSLHDLLLIIITLIALFVLGLLAYVMWRFNEKRNPRPSKTAHNTVIEVLWTVAPVVILVIIAIPSFRLLYFADRTADAEMTLKAIGRQWYWSYEYPDHGNFTFDATMVADGDLQEGQLRLLETDNRVVVPVDTNVRLLVTGADVIHAFAIPSFGVKLDAVPGKVNETWFRVTREGVFYGQCSELCGVGHAYMPIVVEAVSTEKFQQWVTEAQTKFARVDGTPFATVAQMTD